MSVRQKIKARILGNRIDWRELAGNAAVQGHALADELEREKELTASVLALLEDKLISDKERTYLAIALIKNHVRRRDKTKEEGEGNRGGS